jgi:molybdenum cofactor cytidylyltransferase
VREENMAGRSRRMGAPKPLLELDGRTFLRAAIDALRDGGCAVVVAVVTDNPAMAAIARARGAVTAHGRPDAQQVDSLRAGLDLMPDDAPAALVLPVDHPLVRPTTVRALIRAAAADPEAVIRPVYQGEPGHPTLFPRTAWPSLRDPDLPQGARSVVESPGFRTVDVPVDDRLSRW